MNPPPLSPILLVSQSSTCKLATQSSSIQVIEPTQQSNDTMIQSEDNVEPSFNDTDILGDNNDDNPPPHDSGDNFGPDGPGDSGPGDSGDSNQSGQSKNNEDDINYPPNLLGFVPNPGPNSLTTESKRMLLTIHKPAENWRKWLYREVCLKTDKFDHKNINFIMFVLEIAPHQS
ncbi:hypothetical protein Ddc_22965 [Ditylenchus destructor]|nr:hypothetical protein Ddc_22965 [Ditylenchus destructor]